ncbi:hypothetical protein DFP73DRAFT_554483 [Morchella snyderi]|nr:hypothetical protein DFP73DRAFT_554483 [Morchella snyderi]
MLLSPVEWFTMFVVLTFDICPIVQPDMDCCGGIIETSPIESGTSIFCLDIGTRSILEQRLGCRYRLAACRGEV